MLKAVGFAKKYYKQISLGVISASIIILRIIPINRGDLSSDGAINSFRSFGWLDWLAASGQTSPINWFNTIPAWALFSFHDAPPLGFLLQRIFFVLGDSTVIARLPFVIAGIVSIAILYYGMKRLVGVKWGLLTAGMYALTSYSIWAERAVYLEGIEILFIIASIMFGACVFFLEKPSKAYLYIWLIGASCALITKYTALFLIPPILIYFVIHRKRMALFRKHIIVALCGALLVLSPVIMYNAKVYQERGHFDAALSSMVGMHPEDFKVISGRSISANPFSNIEGIFMVLAHNISIPLLAIAVLGFIAVIIHIIRNRKWDSFESWITLNFVSAVGMFSFGAVASRFLSLLVPFVILYAVLGIKYALDASRGKKLRIYAWAAILVFVFVGEFIYSFNTNFLRSPWAGQPWTHSPNKLQDLGFAELERFVRTEVIAELPEKLNIRSVDDMEFSSKDVEGKTVLIFDDRINWFSQLWYLQKYLTYYDWPIFNTTFISGNPDVTKKITTVSNEIGYIVFAIDESVMDPLKVKHPKIAPISEKLLQEMRETKNKPIVIHNAEGKPVFEIYKLIFK